MEILREIGPLVLGMLFIPPIVSAVAGKASSNAKNLLTLLLCLVVGIAWSAFVGEQSARDLLDRLVAVIVDTSLAFTGSFLASWVVWSRLGLSR